MDDLFHGKEVNESKKNLASELLLLQGKYSDIFEDIANTDKSQGEITNHYILMITDHNKTFSIRSDSQLPDYIKKEMVACFNKSFKK
ncbi:hypothetical protein MYP_3294 [Sporocytophaga myxococcoides]|uniref:Uncharacterized protein n=1 Tax=Sporocytophaga myxococcoides TaxID=153721 RepID=A0A098LGH3_9BACT|nr:hypothetical protein MYP_3294 [Sporocytophaga myxococcoides]